MLTSSQCAWKQAVFCLFPFTIHKMEPFAKSFLSFNNTQWVYYIHSKHSLFTKSSKKNTKKSRIKKLRRQANSENGTPSAIESGKKSERKDIFLFEGNEKININRNPNQSQLRRKPWFHNLAVVRNIMSPQNDIKAEKALM